MKILSFHNSLEASAAIYINGSIKSAISEERFNRIKNFHGFPTNSIKYLLNKFKLNFKDLDYIVYGMLSSVFPDEQTNFKLYQHRFH